MAKKEQRPDANPSAEEKQEAMPADSQQDADLTAAETVSPDEPDPAAETETSAETETTPEEETEQPEQVSSEKNAEAAVAPDAAKADEEKEDRYSIRDFASDAARLLKRYEIPEMFLLRCITLYFFVAGFWIVRLRTKFSCNAVDGWHDFIGTVGTTQNILSSLVFMFVGFFALSSFSRALPKKSRIADSMFAIGSVLFFDIALLWRREAFFLTAAISFVSLVFIYYAVGKIKNKPLLEKIPLPVCGGVVLATAVCMTVFVAATTIAKHNIFGTACHDFGLFAQMYHSLAQNLKATTTCERDKALSHFYIHSSYIYYLLVPFYKLIPKPQTLLAAQAVLAVGGIIPMFLIAKRHHFKGLSLIFISFAYIFSIAIIGPCYYDFHENAFLPTLLMWLFWALDSKRMIPSWIFAFLVCMVKEDAPLYIVCIGLFFFFENRDDKKRWHGLLMTVISGAYMMFITSWLTANGDGSVMTSIRFGNLMINPDGGLTEVIKNVLLDPAYFFSLLIHEDTLQFFLQVMLPLLFLPFCTKKIHRFWLMIPFLIMNMSVGAGYGYAANVGFHYIFGPVCLLIYMAILNMDDIGDGKKQELAIVLGTTAIVFFFGTLSHQYSSLPNYKASKESFQKVDEVLNSIPKDAALAASAFMVSHCWDRDELYLFDFSDCDQDNNRLIDPDRYDFYVFGPTSDLGQFAIPLLEELGFTVYAEYDSRVIVYKSPNYQG